jgi:sugar-specific transcriptional regulator TrmB
MRGTRALKTDALKHHSCALTHRSSAAIAIHMSNILDNISWRFVPCVLAKMVFSWIFVMEAVMEAALASLGITGTLFKLYAAAIELGEAPISDVAARAGLVRTTAYHALSRLQEEGLIVFSERNGKRCVIAEDPKVLMERLETRRQRLSAAMPKLRSLYNRIKGKPQIHFHEGGEGIRTALWDCLNLTEEPRLLRGYLSMHELRDSPGFAEMDRFIAARVERGIELKVIRSLEYDIGPIWPSSRTALRELRYAPEATPLAMTLFIYDHRVCLISSRHENYGLVIESEEFSTMQRLLFDTIWSASTPDRPPEMPRS